MKNIDYLNLFSNNNNIYQINKSLNLFKDISNGNISNNYHKTSDTFNFDNNNLNNISISILNPNNYINKDFNSKFLNYNNFNSNIINNNS